MESFLKYVGGKSKLRNEIISMIPPHKTYIEPFCGASWVLFEKPKSPIEFINDVDDELINIYLAVKNHNEKFLKIMDDKFPISESLFDMYIDNRSIQSKIKKIVKVNVYKAVIDYYIIMNSFNGNVSGKPSFAVKKDRKSPFNKMDNGYWLEICNRLKNVTILNRDYKDVFKQLDSSESFFYIDPPYICATNKNNYYKNTFNEGDHQELMVYLKELEGKFILSYGEDEIIRELYKDFNIIESKNIDKELLITNYEIPKDSFYCRKGIPQGPEDLKGIPKQANWKNGNCPYCGSREIQQVSKRVTLKNNSRNWEKCGFVCRDCKELFRSS